MRPAALLLPILLLCAACKPVEKTPETPAPAAATPAIPAAQTAFIALPHDIQAGKPDNATDQFCAAFKAYDRFENWQGKVHDLRISTIDGTAIMEIDIGRGIRLESMTAKSDPFYTAITSLTYGSAVTVSGKFSHANKDADCLYFYGPFGVQLSDLKAK